MQPRSSYDSKTAKCKTDPLPEKQVRKNANYFSDADFQAFFIGVAPIFKISCLFMRFFESHILDKEPKIIISEDSIRSLCLEFIEQIKELDHYTTYVSGYDVNVEKLRTLLQENQNLATSLRQVQQTAPELKRNSIEALMIMPVQRVPRY